MSVSDYIDAPISVTIDYDNIHPVVNFHDKGMEEEYAELMYADHENNVFVFQRWSEIPFEVYEYDKTLLPYGMHGHIVFFIYVGDGRFDIVSRTRQLEMGKLRAAFTNFGFNKIEYRSLGFDHEYVDLQGTDAFKLKMKIGK